MADVQLQAQLNLSKDGAAIQRQLSASFDIGAAIYVAGVLSVLTSDTTLPIGDVSDFGALLLHNLEARVLIVASGAPTVAPQGTPGVATATYKIVAKQSDGAYSAASSAGTTTTSAATLTGV